MNVPAERPADPVAVIRHQMDQMGTEFRRALPQHIPTERFQRVAMTAINRNPDLLTANRKSLFEACMLAAQDGLFPDGREAALVVFGNRVTYMPMVAGIRKKVYQSGEITSLVARAAHENDEFEVVYGDEERIVHKPNLENPGKIIAVYAIATYRDGSKARDVMSLTEVNRIREMSRGKASGPWREHYEEMAKKTVIRRLAKSLPLSSDADEAIRRDDALYEQPQSAATVRQLHPVEPRTIDARLSDFAGEDDEPDTAADLPPSAAEAPADGTQAGAPAASAGERDAAGTSASDPIEDARQAGREAVRAGVAFEAVPKKFARYVSWAEAWREGYQEEGEKMEAEMNQ
jgi:recombination protein RecT